MRYMILVKASATSESGGMPPAPLRAEMAAFHEALARAGVLLDANGLRPSREGWRVEYGQGKPRVVDGPFAETEALIAGYTLIQVPSAEAALEWSRRFPAPFGPGVQAQIEVRRLCEQDDFPQDPALAPFRALQPQ